MHLPQKPMPDLQEKIDWDKYLNALNACQPIKLAGRIVKVAGIVAEADGPGVSVGSLCVITNSEAVKFRPKSSGSTIKE